MIAKRTNFEKSAQKLSSFDITSVSINAQMELGKFPPNFPSAKEMYLQDCLSISRMTDLRLLVLLSGLSVLGGRIAAANLCGSFLNLQTGKCRCGLCGRGRQVGVHVWTAY